jgi:hypothetical protein
LRHSPPPKYRICKVGTGHVEGDLPLGSLPAAGPDQIVPVRVDSANAVCYPKISPVLTPTIRALKPTTAFALPRANAAEPIFKLAA